MAVDHYALSIANRIWQRAGITSALPAFRVKPVKCGRWNATTGNITLPVWIFGAERHATFVEYYIAHELAHHLMGRPGHDVEFQRKLASLVPPHVHAWEIYYKPKFYRQYLRER